MSSNTKAFEEKMKSSVEHLDRELAAVRAGRANPAVLDKVSVDYYGAPTPIQQVASVAVSEARTLTITPWDRTLLRAITKAIMASDVGINPIDDGEDMCATCREEMKSKAADAEEKEDDDNDDNDESWREYVEDDTVEQMDETDEIMLSELEHDERRKDDDLEDEDSFDDDETKYDYGEGDDIPDDDFDDEEDEDDDDFDDEEDDF